MRGHSTGWLVAQISMPLKWRWSEKMRFEIVKYVEQKLTQWFKSSFVGAITVGNKSSQ